MDLRLTAGALALALSSGCLPSDFESVERGGSPIDTDGSVAPSDDGGSARDAATVPPSFAPDAATPGADTGAPMPDARVDGSVPAVPDGGPQVPDSGTSPPPDSGTVACPPPPSGGRAFVASAPVEIGRFTNPSMVESRRIGPSEWLGNKRMWLTTATTLVSGATPTVDTPANYPIYSFDGSERPWTREPLALSAPFRLAEVSASGLPRPLLALPAEEQKMVVGYTPASLVRRGASGGTAFLLQSRGFAYPEAVWLANVSEDGSPATRLPGPLFKKPEPLFSFAAYRGSEYLSVYACGDSDFKCQVARAPIAKIDQHDAYEVWTGSAWSRDLTKGATVIEGPWLDFSVSYNAYLGKYVALYSKWLVDFVVIKTAPAPEGPWQEAATLPMPKPPVWSASYAREQPSLTAESRCSRRLFITHWAPAQLVNEYPAGGDMVLSAIDLQ